DVRGVDLELHEQQVFLALWDVAQVERELAVAAPLADRRRLDRVHGHALEPARAELEHGVLDVLCRLDREPGLPKQPPAYARRRVELQRSLRRGCALRLGPLAE